MADESTLCPYCNSRVNLTETPLPGSRVTCPRCGETFPFSAVAGAAATDAPAPTPESTFDGPMSPQRWSNGTIALIIVSVMTAMALFGYFWASETVEFRRHNDRGIVKAPLIGVPLIVKLAASLWVAGLAVLLARQLRGRGAEPEAANARHRRLIDLGIGLVVASVMLLILAGPVRRRTTQLPAETPNPPGRSAEPAELVALKYVPVDADVLAGLHVAKVYEHPDGREFLKKLRIGPLDLSGAGFQQQTGLALDEIEDVVVAMKVARELMPRTTLIVRTKQPVDSARMRAALQGTKVTDPRRPDRFRFTMKKPALEIDIWNRPRARVLIVGLTASGLEASAIEPHAGITALLPPLRTLLKERVDRDAGLWTAAHLGNWEHPLAQLALKSRPENEQKILSKVRGVAGSLMLGQPLVLRAEIDCADDATAVDLAKTMQQRRPEDISDLKIFTQETWVSVQARMRQAVLQGFLP